MSSLQDGWSIWATSGGRIRQFAVAVVSREEAINTLNAENPDVDVLSLHMLGQTTLQKLGMTVGDITEWVPLDCKVSVIGNIP